MCCSCGFKALEFWMFWLSITSAGFVSSTVFDLSTLTDADGNVLKGSSDSYSSDSDMEMYFLIFSALEALLFLLLLMLILHCCPSKKRIAHRGRREYMIRLVQWIKLLVLVGTVAIVQSTKFMAFKKGDDFNVGRVLLGCEFVSAVVELLILRENLHPQNFLGIFAKTFAETMVSAMVAAQVVKVDQYFFLAAAGTAAFVYALGMASCVAKPEKLELFTPIVGCAAGLALAVAFQGTHSFRSSGEITAYTFLFAFNFAFPMVKHRYEAVEIDAAYQKSYHRAQTPAASVA